jgi:hypothetical protein
LPAFAHSARLTPGSGEDERYLVIFRNTALKTIRDLTQEHVAMLQDVQDRVGAWPVDDYVTTN